MKVIVYYLKTHRCVAYLVNWWGNVKMYLSMLWDPHSGPDMTYGTGFCHLLFVYPFDQPCSKIFLSRCFATCLRRVPAFQRVLESLWYLKMPPQFYVLLIVPNILIFKIYLTLDNQSLGWSDYFSWVRVS